MELTLSATQRDSTHASYGCQQEQGVAEGTDCVCVCGLRTPGDGLGRRCCRGTAAGIGGSGDAGSAAAVIVRRLLLLVIQAGPLDGKLHVVGGHGEKDSCLTAR